MGWLSDRAGRKVVLVACYLSVTASLTALAAAVSLWNFWLAMALGSAGGTALAVGSAYTVDLVPKRSLATAVAWFNTAMWVGGAIGLAGTGNAIQYLGLTPTLMIGACLGLAAVALVAAIRRPAARPVVQAGA
jgi:MFS family permease